MGETKPGDETIIIEDFDEDTIKSELYARKANHRSCWKHMVFSLHDRGKKINKRQAEDLRGFELISQCSLGTIPTRKRSKRRFRPKDTIARVKKKEKLNSGEFDHYFQNLWRSFSEDQRTCFAYFDSMWFSLYMKAQYKGRVLTWIKKKKIFSKKYVIVPIVYWGHWNLLIFCHFGESFESDVRKPCMLLLDSLEIADPRRLEPYIRRFVLDIYRSEENAENETLISHIPLLVPKVPQQRSNVDCGNYVLYYIYSFVQMAPNDFNAKEYPYFMDRNWFSAECLERFFEELEPLEE
ncbi:probable ubiquitin-like-specific protease 2A [Euphorbia lathyris]|uniref:probable ubiquitin-like-specific protease 2A n=1 Tax=Euphorbia lathyris TaxID=212925 RepID=UPI003313908B